MTTRTKVTTTILLLFLLAGIGLADAVFSDNTWFDSSSQLTQSGSTVSQTTVAQVPPAATGGPQGAGVAKQEGPDVAAFLKSQGFEAKTTNDQSLIAQIVSGEVPVSSQSILKNNDRIGSVLWIETAEVKPYFSSLKDSLLAAFSPNVSDLKDITLQEPSTPIRNLLTFVDPNLSTERLTFVRVKDRIYEFHSAEGKDGEMQTLIETLTVQ